MKGSKKDSSNRLGMIFSIALHAGLILLILYWGFNTHFSDNNSGPIQVSISGLDGGTAGSEPPPPPPVKKSEPEPPEPEPEEVVEEEPPPEPEPEKEEVIKEKPKKDAIPLAKPTEKHKPKHTPKPTDKPKPTEKPKPKATPKPTEKPKPKATPKPTKKPEKKDLDKEKERILKDIQRQKVLDELKKDKSEPVDEFENEITEEIGQERKLAMQDDIITDGEPNSGGSSSSTSSGGSAISPLIIQTYTTEVHRKIRRNWTIPPGVPMDENLATSLVFKVEQTGKVIDVRIVSSSGNSVFDNYCRQAIIKSSPLPPPPSELSEEAKKSGLEITFRPDI
jgi:colicin import membrane protein